MKPITGAGKAMKAWKDTAKALETNNELLKQVLAELQEIKSGAVKLSQP